MPHNSSPQSSLSRVWSGEEIEELRRLLMEQWDPIGVYHFADDDGNRECYWDEYDSYSGSRVGGELRRSSGASRCRSGATRCRPGTGALARA